MTTSSVRADDELDPRHRGPRIAVLVDYDGTIASIDVSDELVRSVDETGWLKRDLAYRRGEVGSRDLLEEHAEHLPRRRSDLPDFVGAPPHDPTFAPFVRFAREHGVEVEVVSDGLGFFVPSALARLGLDELPVYAADLDFGAGGPTVSFPHGHPVCTVCGTCKRQPVLRQQDAGCHVVFVGDGHSDRYAAAYADTVFAKGDLAAFCSAEGIPHLDWDSFDDVRQWLVRALAQGEVPPPISRPFICGPETEGLPHP